MRQWLPRKRTNQTPDRNPYSVASMSPRGVKDPFCLKCVGARSWVGWRGEGGRRRGNPLPGGSLLFSVAGAGAGAGVRSIEG